MSRNCSLPKCSSLSRFTSLACYLAWLVLSAMFLLSRAPSYSGLRLVRSRCTEALISLRAVSDAAHGRASWRKRLASAALVSAGNCRIHSDEAIMVQLVSATYVPVRARARPHPAPTSPHTSALTSYHQAASKQGSARRAPPHRRLYLVCRTGRHSRHWHPRLRCLGG